MQKTKQNMFLESAAKRKCHNIQEKEKRKHKNRKTSLSLEMLKFFWNYSVMLSKKTKVLCERHITTWVYKHAGNSRWDKPK